MPERKGIKRGYRIDDYVAQKEAKELAPYLPWEAWKHNLFNYLRTNKLGILNSEEGPHLHRHYLLAVLAINCQLNKASEEEIKQHRDELKKEHPELFENPAFVLSLDYIEKRTQKPQK